MHFQSSKHQDKICHQLYIVAGDTFNIDEYIEFRIIHMWASTNRENIVRTQWKLCERTNNKKKLHAEMTINVWWKMGRKMKQKRVTNIVLSVLLYAYNTQCCDQRAFSNCSWQRPRRCKHIQQLCICVISTNTTVPESVAWKHNNEEKKIRQKQALSRIGRYTLTWNDGREKKKRVE